MIALSGRQPSDNHCRCARLCRTDRMAAECSNTVALNSSVAPTGPLRGVETLQRYTFLSLLGLPRLCFDLKALLQLFSSTLCDDYGGCDGFDVRNKFCTAGPSDTSTCTAIHDTHRRLRLLHCSCAASATKITTATTTTAGAAGIAWTADRTTATATTPPTTLMKLSLKCDY